MHIKVHPFRGSSISYPADAAEIEFDGSLCARQILLKRDEEAVQPPILAKNVKYLTGDPDGAAFKVVARVPGEAVRTFEASGVTFAHNAAIGRLDYVSITRDGEVLATYPCQHEA